MQNVIVKPLNSKHRVLFLVCRVFACLLMSWARLGAIEDPPGCSLEKGGTGNTSQGGIGFTRPEAHVGDRVEVAASLGMVPNACRATNATGIIYIATGLLTNFLVDVTVDPGEVISCPFNRKCSPGPYSFLVTPDLVGARVDRPLGGAPGLSKTVRVVEAGFGTVLSGSINEQLNDIHTASIRIVTPCIQVFATCDLPPGQTCFSAETPVRFRGYVTNCGDINLTNVTVVASRTGQLTNTTTGSPLSQPLTLDTNQAVFFSGSFAPELTEICAGSAPNTITVRGTDTTVIGGPNASVTNSTTVVCDLCVNPCLTVIKDCAPAVVGQTQTVSGGLTNCGDITITNILVSDDIYGSIMTIASLAPHAFTNYSRTFTTTRCGTTTNIVTATGGTQCGATITARGTNVCTVTESPCIFVSQNCTTAGVGQPQRVSGVISNCGNVTLTNIVVNDNESGPITNLTSLAPGVSVSYARNFTAQCGGITNTVTAAGFSPCGAFVSASATEACVVDCPRCLRVIKQCAYPPGTNCFPARTPIQFTGSVTNCGDHELTNVIVIDNRAGPIQLFDPTNGAALSNPVNLPPGAYAVFFNSFLPTPEETCAGNATNVITATGWDVTVSAGPNASVTNSYTDFCSICFVPPGACQLACPPDVITNAGPAGVVVHYPPPVVIGGCSNVDVICTPPSGSTFLPGTHIVQCQVVEAASCPNTCTFAVTVLANCPLLVGAGVVETNTLRVRQTGLFYQTVGVTNSCDLTVTACRLYLEGLSPDVQVYNASGVSNGVPYLQSNLPIPPRQGIEFAVEYYVPNRRTLPNASFRAEVVAAEVIPNPAGTVASVLRALAYTNCAFLVEFSTLSNRTYYVQYRSDPTTNVVWKTAVPAVLGNGTSVQWLDSGPPKTESPPCTQTNRYYRVVLVP